MAASIGDKKLHLGKGQHAYHQWKAYLNLEFGLIETRNIYFHPYDISKESTTRENILLVTLRKCGSVTGNKNRRVMQFGYT